jgi:hypothetical protein
VLEEVRRIQERDFEAANALLDATGDKEQVGQFLGLDLAPDPEPPAPILIDPTKVPVPGQPPAPAVPPAPNGNQPPQPVA